MKMTLTCQHWMRYYFYVRIILCIVGSVITFYQKLLVFIEFQKLANYEHLSKFITVSDEAFVLLCFKNYYFPVYHEALEKVKEKDDFSTFVN